MDLSKIRNKKYLVVSIIIFAALWYLGNLWAIACPNYWDSYKDLILLALSLVSIWILHKLVCYLEEKKRNILGYYLLVLILLMGFYALIALSGFRLFGGCRPL